MAMPSGLVPAWAVPRRVFETVLYSRIDGELRSVRIKRSEVPAEGRTVALAEAVLSPGVTSVGVTVAVLVMVPVAVGMTDMVTEKLALLARLPTLQVTAVGGVKAHGKFAGGMNVTP